MTMKRTRIRPRIKTTTTTEAETIVSHHEQQRSLCLCHRMAAAIVVAPLLLMTQSPLTVVESLSSGKQQSTLKMIQVRRRHHGGGGSDALSSITTAACYRPSSALQRILSSSRSSSSSSPFFLLSTRWALEADASDATSDDFIAIAEQDGRRELLKSENKSSIGGVYIEYDDDGGDDLFDDKADEHDDDTDDITIIKDDYDNAQPDNDDDENEYDDDDNDDDEEDANHFKEQGHSGSSKRIKLPKHGAWLEKATWELLNLDVEGSWTRRHVKLFEKATHLWSRRAFVGSSGNGSRHYRRPALQQEKLVRRLVQEQEAGNSLAWEVDMNHVYHLLIRSWSYSGGRGTAQRCEDILDVMQELYNSGSDNFANLKPKIKTWNNVLLAYAQSKTRDAPGQAARVLSKLQRLLEEGKTDQAPNHESYVAILKSYAHLGGPEAPTQVLQVLDRMTELAAGGFTSIRPNASCHNVFFLSLLASLDLYNAKKAMIVQQAEDHFQKMMQSDYPESQPDIWTYNSLLTLLSKSGYLDSATRAEALVQQMEDRRMSPKAHTYNCLIACYTWSKHADRATKAYAVLEKMKRLGETDPRCRPDAVTFNSVMNVYAKSSRVDAPFIVHELLEEMKDLYKATGAQAIKPTIRSWNICFEVWAKSERPDAPKRIWKQIEQMEKQSEGGGDKELSPSLFTYNSYLSSVAKQRKPTSADEAERVLRFLQEKSRSPGFERLQPEVLVFTNVLHCIALSEADDSFQRAYTILQEMEEGDMDVRPNVYTYNVLINVIAKSKILGKAKIAVQLLRRMKQVSIAPITITMNNILNACAYSDRAYDNRREVLDLALVILKEAQETCGANYITYGSALRVIRFFADDNTERYRLIRKVFRQALNDGQFSPSMLKQLKPALTTIQFELLVKEATDPKTGEWNEAYMQGAKRLKSQAIRKRDSPRYH